jgi:OOP family OmpA-OmpF porin
VKAWPILLVSVLVTACAQMHDRVVLLQGAVVVKTGKGETELSTPYASADVKHGTATLGQSTADDVHTRYGALLEAQPPRPQSFELLFLFDKAELTPDSAILLERIKTAIVAWPAPEIVVIGHTDRVGPESVNDRLSIRRAEAVRDALVAIGISGDQIAIIGRGEHDLAVLTVNEVPEPRNRRAEIKIR